MSDLPKLARLCPECDGYCRRTNPAFRRWASREGLSEEEFADAFHDPPEDAPPAELPCGVCDGEGAIPTDAGQKVLDLVSTFLRADVPESNYFGRLVEPREDER